MVDFVISIWGEHIEFSKFDDALGYVSRNLSNGNYSGQYGFYIHGETKEELLDYVNDERFDKDKMRLVLQKKKDKTAAGYIYSVVDKDWKVKYCKEYC